MAQPKKRPFVSLKGLETGRVTSAGKPVYKYKGEEISEKSIDIEADGKTYVIPTVIDGKLYTEEAAVAKFFNKEVEPIRVLKENIKDRSKKLAKGGTTMNKQMELFEDGGLKEEGGMVDEVSGNDVPVGSTREEVRDDIPAQLSEGEFVFPADVVRYIGLEKLMKLRQEAKQGLKQMEAMGQMGNSDEATMPDDLPFEATDLNIEDEEDVPFDESDLDIEDDLEYNIGGYVPPSYTPPVIPNTQQINIPQIPTQPGIPSIPGFGQPTAQPKLVGFEQLTQASSPNIDGQNALPSMELVRYYNEDTRQVRIIPHLINPDGSRAETLYPVPEGFVPKEGDPVTRITTKRKTPQDKGTQSRDAEDGDDGGKGPGVTAVDPAGDPLSYSSVLSKDLDALGKNMKEIGKMQMSLLGKSKVGILGNMALSALGKTNLNGVNLGAITSYYTAAKKELGLMGKNINDLTTKERNALNNSIERAKASVISLTTDGKGNTMGQQATVAEVNSLASLYGLTQIDTKKNWNLDVKIGKKIAEIDRARDKIRDKMRRRGLIDPQQGFEADEQLGLESLSSKQQTDIMDALGKGIGVNEYGGVSKSALSDIQSIADKPQYSFDTVTSSDTGGPSSSDPGSVSEGGYGGVGATAKGGFINKKKMKPKEMKRGGLASKK